jgi:hypothetical protein
MSLMGCASSGSIQNLQDQINNLQSDISYLKGRVDALSDNLNRSNVNQPSINTSSPIKDSTLQVSEQCQAMTLKGVQCSRKAESGSKYCWQHKKSDAGPSISPSSTDKNIQTGPRGGQYYINSHGNKVYVRKKK